MLATSKRLLILAHAPSPNTQRMVEAVVAGAMEFASETLEIIAKAPLQAGPDDVLAARALILLTPENLGYMSGALKDWFDRSYYPCLEHTSGLPYALAIRAGQSAGDGSRRAVESIASGLKWKAAQPPLVCSGPFRDDFIEQCRVLGQTIAAGLDAGVY